MKGICSTPLRNTTSLLRISRTPVPIPNSQITDTEISALFLLYKYTQIQTMPHPNKPNQPMAGSAKLVSNFLDLIEMYWGSRCKHIATSPNTLRIHTRNRIKTLELENDVKLFKIKSIHHNLSNPKSQQESLPTPQLHPSKNLAARVFLSLQTYGRAHSFPRRYISIAIPVFCSLCRASRTNYS